MFLAHMKSSYKLDRDQVYESTLLKSVEYCLNWYTLIQVII